MKGFSDFSLMGVAENQQHVTITFSTREPKIQRAVIVAYLTGAFTPG